MRELIKTDPKQALAVTVPSVVRHEMPDAVLSELETRVAGTGDYSLLAICYGDQRRHEPSERLEVFLKGVTYSAHSYGRRAVQLTKEKASLHGIVLDGEMAVHESPMRVLEPGETLRRPAFRLSPDSLGIAQQPGRENSGLEASAAALVFEAHGRLWQLSDGKILVAVERALNLAEERGGPHVARFLSSETALQPPAAADKGSSWTTGSQKVLLLRVDFSDLPGEPLVSGLSNGLNPLTAQAALDYLNNKVNPFFEEMSYGKTTLVSTVSAKVYRMPKPASGYVSRLPFMTSDATAAAAADYSISAYDRIMIVFTSLNAVTSHYEGIGGLAESGGSKIWINGYVSSIAHELGHSYGLAHANLWKVTDGNPISDGGTSVSYGDNFDTMGNPAWLNAHFNPWFKNRLGWLDDAQVQTATSSGVFRIFRFDHAAATGNVALKIAKDSNRNYWIGNRRHNNLPSVLQRSAYIIWGYNAPHDSHLLDLNTPGTNVGDATLGVGRGFADPAANVMFRIASEGGVPPREYIDVEVIFGAGAPVINQQPASTAVAPGTSVTFAVDAMGVPAPTSYRWQRIASGSSTWMDLQDDTKYEGASTPRLTVKLAAVAMDGDRFRCVVTNNVGQTTTNGAAALSAVPYGVYTIAGSAVARGSADGSVASARFWFSHTGDCVVDPAGILYATDTTNQAIRKITPGGIVSTLAGAAGVRGSADGVGSAARFNGPCGITIDRAGNLYVADLANHTIRKITPAGVVSTLAGQAGSMGWADGAGNEARFIYPIDCAADNLGNVWVTDGTFTVRKIDSTGRVTSIAGMPNVAGTVDGTGTAARFNSSTRLALDPQGNLIIADSGDYVIRKVTPAGVATTLAGVAGRSGTNDGAMRTGGTGELATFWGQIGLAVDNGGDIWVSEPGVIRRISPKLGTVRTVIGTPIAVRPTAMGWPNDASALADGPPGTARMWNPSGLAFDGAGALWFLDSASVRKFVPIPSPQIQAQPQGRSVLAGDSVTLTVTTTSQLAVTYQWQKNGVDIPGATDGSYSLASAKTTDAGTYTVKVDSSGSTTVSDVATLAVNLAPSITSQPLPKTVNVGASTSFSVSADGVPGPAYQWRFNGAPIAGATDATLSLSNVQAAAAGGYSVIVSNAAGSMVSLTATLEVNVAPVIAANPGGKTVNVGEAVTFSVSASGQPAPSYQWRFNGAPIAGATGATLSLSNVQAAAAGGYSVIVSNAAGSMVSLTATLEVNVAPVIAANPGGKTVKVGEAVTFSVSASGQPAPSYQWRFNGAPIAGATGATLSLSNVQAAAAGGYSVIVSNAAGSVVSLTATLDVLGVSRISNLSILANLSATSPLLTVGTVIGGAGTNGRKPLLVRAAGPALAALGVAGVLADPKLELFSGQTVVGANDNWSGTAALSAAFTDVGAFAYGSVSSKDAALFNDSLQPGNYTLLVAGVGGPAGLVIAELYDSTPANAFTTRVPRLINVSVLKPIAVGELLTAGFVITGMTPKTVLIRAVGPTLGAAPFNVPGVVADPKLDLISGQKVINSNNDWGGGSALANAFTSVGAFGFSSSASKDAALLVTLQPGSYTVQVSGVGSASGFVLVEVYEVPSP